MSIRSRARAWWNALLPRTPRLISTRTDPWAVEWVITDALTNGFSMGVAGTPDREQAYQRAIESLAALGDDADFVTLRLGHLTTTSDRGPELTVVFHESRGSIAEVRAQIHQWHKDHQATLTHHLGDTAHPIGEGR